MEQDLIKPTKEQLNLLNKKYLFFGSPNEETEVVNGKYLTMLPGIASIFMIDMHDLFQFLNKPYKNISFEYDVWNRKPDSLLKPAKFVKITNNVKDWIKTSGTSQGYIHRILLTDKIKAKLKIVNNSDIRYEVVYDGNEPLKIDKVFKRKIKWNCKYSSELVAKYGEASFITKYEPPYPLDILKEKYPKLLKDPVHVWRAKNEIELIHKEPTYDEQKRIFFNWLAMPRNKQEISDKKEKELVDATNMNYHNFIMEKYWHDENYKELSDLRKMYDNRDMFLNGLKYIHLSRSSKPLVLKPRIPETTTYLENKTVPRICVSTSMFGALAAVPNKGGTKRFYVHLIEPQKVLENEEVLQYVPDAGGSGECWVFDDEIETKVVGEVIINCDLPNIYAYSKKSDNNFRCLTYKDYTFTPFESLTKRTSRQVLLYS